MDIGPDGSLCRITSSVKHCLNNVRIVKVSEEEFLKSNGPHYKLVLIGEEESDSESLSENSDEEPFEIKSIDIELSAEKNVENKDNENKTQEVVEDNPQNKKIEHKRFNNRHQSKNKYRKRYNYNSSNTRNFKSSSNATMTYNRQRNNVSNDISPWLPTALHAGYQHQHIIPFEPVAEACTPGNSSINKSFGLLGDSPSSVYPFPPPNFPANHLNNPFAQNHNRWNEEYYNNYQVPFEQIAQDPPVSGEPMFKKRNNYTGWKNRNRQKSWKRNQDQNRKRRGNDGRFHY